MFDLNITGLSKTYKNGGQALKNINLDVKKGEFLALLGKNGAGKTTFVEILSSLTQKTSGEVLIRGKEIEKNNEFIKSCVGIVPQEFNLSIFETTIQTLITQAGYFGIDNKTAYKRAENQLKALDLWEKRDNRVITLSGGMKRRLMIARALMHEPEIIFFDEPTAGVDVEVRQKIWTILENLNKEGKTIILTTHYFEEAEKLCDSLAIIHKGEILIHDSLSNIFHKYPKQKYLIELKESKNLKIEAQNIKALSASQLEIMVNKKHSLNQTIKNIISQGGIIQNIQPQNTRLEEIFLNITN
jgi:ABC-2 type transport system ATP-binding protein